MVGALNRSSGLCARFEPSLEPKRQPLGPIRPTTERDGVQGRAASGLTGRARAWRTGWAGSGRPPDMAKVQAPDFANLHDHAALRSLDWPTVGIFVDREVSSRPMISK